MAGGCIEEQTLLCAAVLRCCVLVIATLPQGWSIGRWSMDNDAAMMGRREERGSTTASDSLIILTFVSSLCLHSSSDRAAYPDALRYVHAALAPHGQSNPPSHVCATMIELGIHDWVGNTGGSHTLSLSLWPGIVEWRWRRRRRRRWRRLSASVFSLAWLVSSSGADQSRCTVQPQHG